MPPDAGRLAGKITHDPDSQQLIRSGNKLDARSHQVLQTLRSAIARATGVNNLQQLGKNESCAQ